jgi:hypothetical protein
MSRETTLIEFAKYVLRMLEETEDWDADMTDAIAQAARLNDLAWDNGLGEFRMADDLR